VARDLYARCGYVIFGRETDHPPGHADHLMRGTYGFDVGTIRKCATGAAKWCVIFSPVGARTRLTPSQLPGATATLRG
jgi:hypothetical protein